MTLSDYADRMACRPMPKSMSTNAHHAACPSCGSGELVTVSFEREGATVIFRTCPPCEAKWWERDGTRIDRDAALPIVTAA